MKGKLAILASCCFDFSSTSSVQILTGTRCEVRTSLIGIACSNSDAVMNGRAGRIRTVVGYRLQFCGLTPSTARPLHDNVDVDLIAELPYGPSDRGRVS